MPPIDQELELVDNDDALLELLSLVVLADDVDHEDFDVGESLLLLHEERLVDGDEELLLLIVDADDVDFEDVLELDDREMTTVLDDESDVELELLNETVMLLDDVLTELELDDDTDCVDVELELDCVDADDREDDELENDWLTLLDDDHELRDVGESLLLLQELRDVDGELVDDELKLDALDELVLLLLVLDEDEPLLGDVDDEDSLGICSP